MKTARLKIILFICIVYVSFSSNAQKPETAGSILKEAYVQAEREHKNVFIIFHASWCGWCHKMDSSMNDKACKSFFTDNYIIRHLVVHESKAKKHLENPGALELLNKYSSVDQGIPFWLVFDKDGKLLADSQMRAEGEGLDHKGQNSGCPASAPEVSYFITVLKKTSRITEPQLKIIEKRFRENED